MTLEAIRSGIDLSYVDTDARPQDDLFGHVNGRWLAEYEIPADRATDGAFRYLFDRAEEQVRDLITEASSSDAARMQRPSNASAISTPASSTRTPSNAGAPNRCSTSWPRSTTPPTPTRWPPPSAPCNAPGWAAASACMSTPTPKTRRRYLVHVNQSGIGLPDESYFRDEQHAEVLAAYPGHIATMFSLVYGGDPEQHADTAARIVALETKLAAAHWDVVKRRDADLTYNLRTFADLQAEGVGFDWAGWVTALGGTPEQVAEVVVRQPDYLTAFAALWGSEDLEDWKRWARWRLIRARAPWLTDAIVAADFDFYGRLLTGHRADPRPLEAGGVAGGGPDGRRRRKALRGNGISRRMPRPASTLWSTTCKRRTGSASATWTG